MSFVERWPWALPAAAFAASRALTVAGFAAAVGSWSPGTLLHVAASRYDAGFYSMIATHAYRTNPFAVGFYPGYPLLARAAMFLVPSVDLALVLTSNLAAVGAALALHRLYSPRWGPGAASVGVTLLLCAPAAIFLGLAFSEATFLLAVTATFLAGSRGWWVVAGATGAAACLVRSNGVLLALPLLVLVTRRRAWGDRPALLIAGLAFAAGAGAYPLYLLLAFGDPLLYFHVQASHWHHHLVSPLTSVRTGLSRMRSAVRALVTRQDGHVRVADAAAVFNDGAMLVAAAGGLAAGWRWLEPEEWLWILAVAAPALLALEVPDSLGRYLLAAFPLYLLAARLLQRAPAGAAVPAGAVLVVGGLALQAELAFRLGQGYFIG